MPKKSVALDAFFKKLAARLNPRPQIAGLSVTDTSIRYVLVSGGKPKTASLRLPEGIIVDGTIKNRELFRKALQTVHEQISGKKKDVHVIFSLPPQTVFTQAFNLPLLEKDELKEALRLNLEMISPLDREKTFASAEEIGISHAAGGQMEFLGAFAEREVVQAFSDELLRAGFMVTAVEFPALGIVRLMREAEGIAEAEPYVAMHIAQSGITFIVVKQLRLYFAHFHSWQSVREEVGVTDEIPPDAFQKFVIKEMQKVYNFYGTRESGTVQSMFVIATTDTASIREAIEANFNVRIKPLAIKRYGGLTPDWFAVLGAAARGTVAPSRDTDINVSGDPVRVQYERTRVLTFIRYWRNVLATTALFIALVYAGVTLFLRQEEMRVARGVDELTAAEEVAAVEVLQEEANRFNALVNLVAAADGAGTVWSSPLLFMQGVAGTEVAIQRIGFSGSSVSLSGTAVTDVAVLAFKDRLEASDLVENVALPIANIKAVTSGGFTFTISFSLTELES